jgi:hypothetical protein
MDEREVAERMRLMATVIGVCSASYFITFSISNSVKDPAAQMVRQQSKENLRLTQELARERSRNGGGGLKRRTSREKTDAMLRKRDMKVVSSTTAESSTDDNTDASPPQHLHKKVGANVSSGTESHGGGSNSDSGRSNYAVFLAKDPSFYRGLDEDALQMHLDVECDKLLTQRIWKYLFAPMPVDTSVLTSGDVQVPVSAS